MNPLLYNRKWRRENRDKVLAGKKRYRRAHPDRVKQQLRTVRQKNKEKYGVTEYRWWLKKKYNITEHQFLRVLKNQKHKCAICESRQLCGSRRKLCVDHDHKTGAFRGLLCFRCNVMLGAARDHIRILKEAIKYLRRKS